MKIFPEKLSEGVFSAIPGFGLLCLMLLYPSFVMGEEGSRGLDSYLQDSAAFAERAVGADAGDYLLVDSDGSQFSLKSLYTDRPVVVSFIYTSCPHICPAITKSLKRVAEASGGGLGKDFVFITIGFDSERDKPEILRNYGKSFTSDFKAWRFASADAKTISSIAAALGFSYRKTPDNGFDHINMITVISPGGRVYAQAYGTEFEPQKVLNIIKDSRSGKASAGGGGGAFTKVKDLILYVCFTYDPATGRYVPNYGMMAFFFAGLAAQAGMVFLVIHLYRGAKRRNVEKQGDVE